MPISCIRCISLQEKVLEACKLHRHYSQHCKTKTKGCPRGAGAMILFNTEAVQLTQDWLELTMGHAKGSDWWGVGWCVHVIAKYWLGTGPIQHSNNMRYLLSHLRRVSYWQLHSSRTVPREVTLPHSTEECLSCKCYFNSTHFISWNGVVLLVLF